MLIDAPSSPNDPAREPLASFVLAHGAGSTCDAPIMNQLATGLAVRGIEVVRFEFPYMERLRREGKRGPPDRMPVLEARYSEVIAGLADRPRLFIGGRSMGGRVATQLADKLKVRGVIALGYPFHPPNKPETLRVEHLLRMQTRCLVVQGTRDPFGSPEEIARYALPDNIELHWLADGDHSFAPRKQSGHTLAGHVAEACDVMKRFMLACP